MVHARVSNEYIHFTLMYRTDHIFPVLPIRHLLNKDDEPTTPHKLSTGKKPSVSKVRVLFYPCVVLKANSHVETETLIMRHQSKKRFWGIFIGIPQHQKGYLIYVPIIRKIVSSHDVVFDETFSSVVAYTSYLY